MYRFVGVVGGGQLNKRAMVLFAWRIVVGKLHEECMVEARCDNACAKGVPLPKNLKDSCSNENTLQKRHVEVRPPLNLHKAWP